MAYFQSVSPCFTVADVGSTMRWYEKQLAFSSTPFPQEEPFVFCILRRNQIEIMLQGLEGYEKPDLYRQRAGGIWDAYIRINGIEALYNSVKEQVEIVQPLHRQPYGCSEFEIRDPNGYVLVFSE